MEEAMLKYVFCNYGGVLTVEDVHGNRVKELCGGMTLDKYNEIENRSHPDITEFEGLEHYKRIVAELEQEKQEQEQQEEKERILGFPRRARPQPGISSQATQISEVMVENTGKKEASVFLFGAATYQIAKNFGNCPDIVIDQPNRYAQLLSRTLVQPIPVKSISIHNLDRIGGNGIIEVISKSPIGGIRKQDINLANFCSNLALQNTIAEINQAIVFDGNLEFNFKLKGNSKTIIALYH